MSPWGVYSEVGKLHTVMVHQPGWEHRRMLPWNKEAMLFDDIIDIDFARPEHKEFVHKMASHGVEVLHFADLLKDVCSDPKRHAEVVCEVTGDECDSIDPMAIQPSQLILGYPPTYRFDQPVLLEPLPNLYFMRDPAFVIHDHVIIAHFQFLIRHRESQLARAVFTRHPMFDGLTVYDGILNDPDARIEGGDVLVADDKTVLVGISERTNEAGAGHLAQYLFENTLVQKLIKVFIPKRHDFMHLDTLFTFVDRQQIVTLPMFWDRPDIFARIAEEVRHQCAKLGTTYHGPDPEDIAKGCSMEVLYRNGDRFEHDRVLEGLADLGVIEPEITVEVGGNHLKYGTPEEHVQEALREQWNDAANTFALKPGAVFSYSRNASTVRALEDVMVEVIPFLGGELVRGRGGPRCMTMPLRRDRI